MSCFNPRQFINQINQLKKDMKKQLTVEQAIAEGFEYAGHKDVGWQNYVEISDMHEQDLKDDSYYLVSKEKDHPSISAEMIKDLITDDVDCRFCDETGCDDSTVSDALHDVDFSAIAKEVNEALSVIWSSKITDIQLINKPVNT